MNLLKSVKFWIVVIGTILSVVMAVLLDATFTEWVSGFLSITAVYVAVKGGAAGIKKVRDGRTST